MIRDALHTRSRSVDTLKVNDEGHPEPPTTSASIISDLQDLAGLLTPDLTRWAIVLAFMYAVVQTGCAYNDGFAEETWLQIVDIAWPWKEGDEEWAKQGLRFDRLLDERGRHLFSTLNWKTAGISIIQRSPNPHARADSYQSPTRFSPEWEERIRHAGPHLRFAAIAWFILTSECMKEPDLRRGLRARGQYDLGSLIDDWRHVVYDAFVPEFRFSLPRKDDAYNTFALDMKSAGHTCHQGNAAYVDGLNAWITMMSWLEGDDRVRVLHLNRLQCGRCARPVRYSIHSQIHDSSSSLQIWHTFLGLAAGLMAKGTNLHTFQMLERLHALAPWTCDTRLLGSCEDYVRQHVTLPEPQFLPWINRCPSSWRRLLTMFSDDDWQKIQYLRVNATSLDHVRGLDAVQSHTDVNLRVRAGAVIWELAVQCTSNMHDATYQWFDSIKSAGFRALAECLPPVDMSAAVLIFRENVRGSLHECYTSFQQSDMDWHASVMSFVNGTDHVQASGIRNPAEINPACRACKSAQDVPSGAEPPVQPPLHSQTSAPIISDHVTEAKPLGFLAYMPPVHSFKILNLPYIGVHETLSLFMYEMIHTGFLGTAHERNRHESMLRAELQDLDKANIAERLSRSRAIRMNLLSILAHLRCSEDRRAFQAMEKDDIKHASLLEDMMNSDKGKKYAQSLTGEHALGFLVFLQETLDHLPPEDLTTASGRNKFRQSVHRLLVTLSQKYEALPPSLFVGAVELPDKNPISGGGFADVYKGKLDEIIVAVKRLRVYSSSAKYVHIQKRFFREALMWRQLCHSFVLPFLGVDAESFPHPCLCMVSPWMKRGNILNYLEQSGPLNVDVDRLLGEVAQGLQYLHGENIVHGDLRGANIFVDDAGRSCIADFGLADFAETTKVVSKSTSHDRSVRWMAPELHIPEMFGQSRFRRTRASDVYAYGCLSLEVYTGRAPFQGISADVTVAFKVVSGERPSRPTAEDCSGRTINDTVWHLVQRCWNAQASERPHIQEITDVIS